LKEADQRGWCAILVMVVHPQMVGLLIERGEAAQPNANEADFLQEGNALQAVAGGSPDRRKDVGRPPQRRLTRQRLEIGEAQSVATELAR
jgi:hypothetical protein